MKTLLHKIKQNRLRTALAGLVGILVLLTTSYFTRDNQPSLSAQERLLVGEWYDDPTKPTRIFHADRTFETSDRQFAGTWQIKRGHLSVTYWQPYELPHSLSLASLSQSLETIQRSYRKDGIRWEITFADSDQRLSLYHPKDKEHPDGKWWWTRKADL